MPEALGADTEYQDLHLLPDAARRVQTGGGLPPPPAGLNFPLEHLSDKRHQEALVAQLLSCLLECNRPCSVRPHHTRWFDDLNSNSTEQRLGAMRLDDFASGFGGPESATLYYLDSDIILSVMHSNKCELSGCGSYRSNERQKDGGRPCCSLHPMRRIRRFSLVFRVLPELLSCWPNLGDWVLLPPNENKTKCKTEGLLFIFTSAIALYEVSPLLLPGTIARTVKPKRCQPVRGAAVSSPTGLSPGSSSELAAVAAAVAALPGGNGGTLPRAGSGALTTLLLGGGDFSLNDLVVGNAVGDDSGGVCGGSGTDIVWGIGAGVEVPWAGDGSSSGGGGSGMGGDLGQLRLGGRGGSNTAVGALEGDGGGRAAAASAFAGVLSTSVSALDWPAGAVEAAAGSADIVPAGDTDPAGFDTDTFFVEDPPEGPGGTLPAPPPALPAQGEDDGLSRAAKRPQPLIPERAAAVLALVRGAIERLDLAAFEAALLPTEPVIALVDLYGRNVLHLLATPADCFDDDDLVPRDAAAPQPQPVLLAMLHVVRGLVDAGGWQRLLGQKDITHSDTPLHRALRYGHRVDVCSALLAEADAATLLSRTGHSWLAGHSGARSGHVYAVFLYVSRLSFVLGERVAQVVPLLHLENKHYVQHGGPALMEAVCRYLQLGWPQGPGLSRDDVITGLFRLQVGVA